MEQYPIITIGRQFGSGGKLTALAIGDKLGIPVYDKELLAKAAEESGYSKDLFIKNDERRSFFSFTSFFETGKWFNSSDDMLSDNELFRIQSEVITAIASKGPAVFVGRCSDYVLRDHKCLSVFITAPEKVRIQRVAERCSISEDEALNLIQKMDRTRANYYNFFTFKDWAMASTYNLCIDSSVLGIDGSADFIIAFAKAQGLF